MTLSGFSVEELRQFITFFVDTKMQPICIFAKALDLERQNKFNRKLIGYLVTDFHKS
jgi:formiminoglutamase